MTSFVHLLGAVREVARDHLNHRRLRRPPVRKERDYLLGRGRLHLVDAVDFAICEQHDDAVLALSAALELFTSAAETPERFSAQDYLRPEGMNPAETQDEAVALLRFVVFSGIAAGDRVLLSAYEKAWIDPPRSTPFSESTSVVRALMAASMHASRGDLVRAQESLAIYVAAGDPDEDEPVTPIEAGVIAAVQGNAARLQAALNELWQKKASTIEANPYAAFEYFDGSIFGEQSRALTRIAEQQGMRVSIPKEQIEFDWPRLFDAVQYRLTDGTSHMP